MMITSKERNLISCSVCGLLLRADSGDNMPGLCPRCGRKLAFRRHNAIQATWALIIAAVICYIPANILPIMTRSTITYTASDTIMDGIIGFYMEGSWPIALIILIASIVIPMAKLAALSYLLLVVQFRLPGNDLDRTRLYRMVEFIGRWSMLDVFVVAVAVALLQLQPFLVTRPAMGLVFFAAVVILTMLAANTFDPRLLWDAKLKRENEHGR
jgi:paraquat-inducible protein A